MAEPLRPETHPDGAAALIIVSEAIVNVNGGTIAFGHPLGCSGARIIATLVHEMTRRENVCYGLATLCLGVGQGAAMIFEKCEV